MTHAEYVLTGYAIVLGTLALYAWRTARRGRRLAARVAPEELPWT